MAAPTKRNSYRFPNGYAHWPFPGKYVPWSAASAGVSPARVYIGATQIFNIASVPADLSTFILNTPDGRSFTFQFVYNASVQTLGIKVPLPLSGASTAAQVQTAMLGVLGLAGGTPLAGSFVSYPWTYTQTGAAQFTISWTVKGIAVVAAGTQATITAGAVGVPFFSLGPVCPARFGRNYAWMHGN